MEFSANAAQLRANAAISAEDENKLGHLEGYAQKLLQGFAKLDEPAAWKAPWELMQNACDLTAQCCVTVDFQNDGLAFSHNGEPFSPKTLGSLIIQKSGEKRLGQELAREEDRLPVGQYGTGFMTTHSYGRVIRLDATLLGGAGPIALTNFLLDRSTEAQDEAGKLAELTSKLLAQEKEMYRLLRETEPLPAPGTITTYRYQPVSDAERRKIGIALASLRLYLPYVLALSNKLHQVVLVEANGSRAEYVKHPEVARAGYWQVPVSAGGNKLPISCLRSADGEVVVVLPLTEGEVAVEPPTDLARLFLYFPLIGTQGWGCNFLIHAKHFTPLELRNGLELAIEVEDASQKTKRNQELLLAASEMVFDFLEEAVERIGQPIHLARIAFGPWPTDDGEVEQYFPSKLQQLWVERFRELPLVDTPGGRRKVASCWFLAPELLQDPVARLAIHAVAAQLWEQQLPSEELAAPWATVLEEWQDRSVQWITAKRLAEKLAAHGSWEGLESDALRQTYAYLLEQGQAQLFEDYALLPVTNGKFRLRKDLKRPHNLTAGYWTALRGIVPEVEAGFIASAFAGLGVTPEKYGRKELGSDVTEKTKTLRGEGNLPQEQVAAEIAEAATQREVLLTGLLALNCIFPSLVSPSAAPSTRRKLLPLLIQFYNRPLLEEIVPKIEDDHYDLDDTPFTTLLKVFLAEVTLKYSLDKTWAAGALPWLLECLAVLVSTKQVRDVVRDAAVFPNQLNNLCKPIGMLIEQDFAPAGGDAEQDAMRLKSIYASVMNTDIRAQLIHTDFKRALNYPEFKPETQTGVDLAGKIEQRLREHSLEEIVNHPKKKEIIEIIKLFADYPNTEWDDLFQTIYEKRASIMLAKLQSPQVKDDLFSIISLEDEGKIAMLGNLVRNKDFEIIIALGQQAVADAARRDADFEFKKEIGVMIEDLIRQRIQAEVAGLPVQVEEQQGGQDIVVKLNGQVVYYLEVKSRWQADYITKLSHKQAERAAENPDCYTLCCVDLTTYFPTGEAQRHVITAVEQIEGLIRFLPDIGRRVNELTAAVRVAEKQPDVVKLAEKYGVLVPPGVVKEGVGLIEFIKQLREQLTISALSIAKDSAVLGHD